MISRVLSWMAPVAAFVVLAWRQLRFIDRYAVNVLFFDQWGFYYPLFHGQSWWETFDRRHGPHRQGIGLVLTRILANLTGWNSRGDAFAVGAAIIGAAVLALFLIKLCGNRAGFAAALAVPVLFFNVHQFEGFVGASNLSHGAMPIFLLMAFSVACFMGRPGWRLAVLSVLTFLLIFTGFGLFAGLLAPLLFAVEGVQAFRAGDRHHALLAAAAFASVLVSWAFFAHGYVFDPAIPNFRFPYERPLQYPVFVGRMLVNLFGWARLSAAQAIVGMALACALVAVCVRHGWRCLRFGILNERRSAVLFFLTAYELLYCANNALGRVMLGDAAPLASRYVTLVIPAGLVIVLELSALRRGRAAFWCCLVFAAAIAPGDLVMRTDEMDLVHWYYNFRSSWKAAYLATHNQQEANRRAHFSMYPVPLTFELSYLEEHHLNLFKPESGP